MGLKIVKKLNSQNKIEKTKAVITILGLIGGDDRHEKANYYYEDRKELIKEDFSTFPLLIKEYSKNFDIVPIFTKEAKEENIKVLKKEALSFNNFKESCFIEDDKNFEDVFKIINESISFYDEVIVDVSHGFRHLPILMIVDLIIQNFQDTSKISKILFAKEIKKFKEYEIIDLKKYLDLANISFVLTTFEKNYTVASHIKSKDYEKLLKELNDFSNDLMALNVGNLFKTSKKLIDELDKIEDISIKTQSKKLKKVIERLMKFDENKMYEFYYNLSKDLFEKNYILLSLSLLYESTVLYIIYDIQTKNRDIYKKLEEDFKKTKKDSYIYHLGNLLKNLYKNYEDNKQVNRYIINQNEYKLLQNTHKNLNIKTLLQEINNKRNDLAHANSVKSFQDINKEVKNLIFKYETQVINKR
ncbi:MULTISPECIES: TM1812 family CRISPR-associated protein [Arcobacteraceae]|uniref:CRISPR-associated (Cas) DxTHG family protein n=2 Tax=Arcobacteraceae TaxID=2808963 RepID=A0ABX2YAL3_9BACT|nr:MULTISPECIES: TM1812 family CRISPR-associated protein [Arcobacteraceae]OCL82271.1 CRISPR-associated (Cas) DxTHG family protein [Arcobacter porcinus]OCL90772.1 CRISPR-associated (Cas) DxTHG family protein [Arcobacter porcinus]OCL95816.1 CRISPR-associated (Cas) DxTHG family protein [Aliarcobacter thereius LMG 24486]QBF16210.1 CRISPR/Cas system-associated protein Csx1, type III [Aliarcobacter thereius LMG 24486]TLS92165.1 CRISPR-associated DxTHG motif protein [Aliarcobacter thereius]